MVNTSKSYKIIYVVLFILLGIFVYQSSSFKEDIYDFSETHGKCQ